MGESKILALARLKCLGASTLWFGEDWSTLRLGTHSQRRSNQRATPSCCPVVLWRRPIGFVWRLLLRHTNPLWEQLG